MSSPVRALQPRRRRSLLSRTSVPLCRDRFYASNCTWAELYGWSIFKKEWRPPAVRAWGEGRWRGIRKPRLCTHCTSISHSLWRCAHNVRRLNDELLSQSHKATKQVLCWRSPVFDPHLVLEGYIWQNVKMIRFAFSSNIRSKNQTGFLPHENSNYRIRCLFRQYALQKGVWGEGLRNTGYARSSEQWLFSYHFLCLANFKLTDPEHSSGPFVLDSGLKVRMSGDGAYAAWGLLSLKGKVKWVESVSQEALPDL